MSGSPRMQRFIDNHWLHITIPMVIISCILVTTSFYYYFGDPNYISTQKDIPNYFSLIVEASIGIIITLIVYDSAKKSDRKIDDKITATSYMVKKGFDLKEQNKLDSSWKLYNVLRDISRIIDRIFQLNTEYESPETKDKSGLELESGILVNFLQQKLKPLTDETLVSADLFERRIIEDLKTIQQLCMSMSDSTEFRFTAELITLKSLKATISSTLSYFKQILGL